MQGKVFQTCRGNNQRMVRGMTGGNLLSVQINRFISIREIKHVVHYVHQALSHQLKLAQQQDNRMVQQLMGKEEPCSSRPSRRRRPMSDCKG